MGKSPRKALNPEPSKRPAKRPAKYPKARKSTYSKKPQTGGKQATVPTRRFSLVDSDSDSPLSNVSDIEEPQAYEHNPVFSDSEEDAEYWRSATAEVNAIMGSSSSSENESDYDGITSSSDDSDVDFVKLTAERKARAMKTAQMFQTHGVKRPPKKVLKGIAKKGPLKAKAELPDLDFEFEFDQDDHLVFAEEKPAKEEEDLGEEVSHSSTPKVPNTPKKTSHLPKEAQGDFLGKIRRDPNGRIIVPRDVLSELEDDEDDYDLDDKALLATLEADDNDKELLESSSEESDSELDEDELDDEETRRLMYVMDDADVDDDALLREEHDNILADFQDGRFGDDFGFLSQPVHFDDEFNKQAIAASINEINHNSAGSAKQFVYSDDDSNFEDYDFDSDGNDSQELFDADDAFFRSEKPAPAPPASHKHKKHDSDDDDSYLWNYFFSSAESDSDRDKSTLMGSRFFEAPATTSVRANFDEDLDVIYNDLDGLHNDIYDNDVFSGESTDEDSSIPPPSAKPQLGSKNAQEVLSSSSVGTRPPVLGTWVTKHDRPYEIIDGLTTRSLTPAAEKAAEVAAPLPVEPALQLDELFNMSDLEDSVEVVRDPDDAMGAWDAFDRARKVPLSAFRNKGMFEAPPAHGAAPNMRRYSLSATNRRRSSTLSSIATPRGKKLSFAPPPSPKAVGSWSEEKSVKKMAKLNRRRQSVAEAAAEGLRSTKSGLFSEDTLQGVEELLADLEAGDVGELFKEF